MARRWRARRARILGVAGGPFGPAVPRAVVVGAVPVVLAVGLVVLGVVGDEVGQGEAVVDGDQVDRRRRPPARGGRRGRTSRRNGRRSRRARPSWPRQKSRIVSRYLPFHSRHSGGNRPSS